MGHSLAAMVYHDQDDAERAQSHLDEGWERIEYYYSRIAGPDATCVTRCVSVLAIEARSKITGETLPNDYFWRHWEASLAIPEDALRLIDRGAEWQYLHPVDGVDPAVTDPDFQQTFFSRDYDDHAWSTGREDDGPVSGFGYGDPVAVVWEKPEKGQRKTAYLRCHFDTEQEFSDLRLRMQCDDGAIVYLDGQEVGRLGIPPKATEGYELMTGGMYEMSGSDERRWRVVWLGGRLPAGSHVLAISLHNISPESSDLRIGNMVLFGSPVGAESKDQ